MAKAEASQARPKYNLRHMGEKKCKFICISQFTTLLQSLEATIWIYHQMMGVNDDQTHVQFLLMAGFKTRDFNPVMTRIMSSPELKVDFDSSVNLYRDYIQSQLGHCGVNTALSIVQLSMGNVMAGGGC